MPINLFPNKKTYLTKAESQLVSQEFDAMFYSNLFIIFGTTEFQTPSRAKKKTDRTRGAMEVDNVAQSDLSTKILVLHLSCNAMGPKNLWNCIQIP